MVEQEVSMLRIRHEEELEKKDAEASELRNRLSIIHIEHEKELEEKNVKVSKLRDEASVMHTQQKQELEEKDVEISKLRDEVSMVRLQCKQELEAEKAESAKMRDDLHYQYQQDLDKKDAESAKVRDDLDKLKQQLAAERVSSSSQEAKLREIATLKTNEADQLRERLSLAQQGARQMALGMKTFFDRIRSKMDDLHQHGSKIYEWLTDVEKGARHEPFNPAPYNRDQLADAALSMFGVSKDGFSVGDTRWWNNEDWEAILLGFCESNRLFGDLKRPEEAHPASTNTPNDTTGTWSILGELSDDELALVPRVQNPLETGIGSHISNGGPAVGEVAQQPDETGDGTRQQTLDEMQSSVGGSANESSVAAATTASHDNPSGPSSAIASFDDRQSNANPSIQESEAVDTLDIDLEEDTAELRHPSATGSGEADPSPSAEIEAFSIQELTASPQADQLARPHSPQGSYSIAPTTPSSAKSKAASTPTSNDTPTTISQTSPESAKQEAQAKEAQSLSERKTKKNKKKYEKKKAKAAEMTADQKAAKQSKRLERKERAVARKAAEAEQGGNET